MESVVEVKPLENYHIWVRFADNYCAVVNIKPFINKGISLKLSDEKYFVQVKLDPYGGVAWDNGFDFCPSCLRELCGQANQ